MSALHSRLSGTGTELKEVLCTVRDESSEMREAAREVGVDDSGTDTHLCDPGGPNSFPDAFDFSYSALIVSRFMETYLQ